MMRLHFNAYNRYSMCPAGFNKGRSLKSCVGCRVRQTPEEGRRTYRSKRCGNNNKDEDNSPKTLTDKNRYGLFTRHTNEFMNISAFYCFFIELLRSRSSGGCRFNFDYRQVTIQENLTLAPGYG